MADLERYKWEGSPSQAAAQAILSARDDSPSEDILSDYGKVVTELHNEGRVIINLGGIKLSVYSRISELRE